MVFPERWISSNVISSALMNGKGHLAVGGGGRESSWGCQYSISVNPGSFFTYRGHRTDSLNYSWVFPASEVYHITLRDKGNIQIGVILQEITSPAAKTITLSYAAE